VTCESGEIDSSQSYWLKFAEVLRRLDRELEVACRQEETQIPLRQAEEAATTIAEWPRISFMSFLSSEANTLIGIRDIGGWDHYAL
jgi:hypothetical protein